MPSYLALADLLRTRAVANLDYNATSKDTVSLKYFYQHDPTLAPYSYSSVPGFTEHLDSGAQVASIINTLVLKSNLSTTQTLGYRPRERLGRQRATIWSEFYSRRRCRYGVDQHVRLEVLSRDLRLQRARRLSALGQSSAILNIGPNAEGQAPNTGMFQNRLAPSGNAIWILGKHTIGFGASYTYTQLNTIDTRTGKGTVATDDFSQMIQGLVTPGSSATGFYVTSFLQGDASRYYRANQLGIYVQDKFQITPTLSLTAGVRYDWDGGLTEKYGRLFNFDPKVYSYNVSIRHHRQSPGCHRRQQCQRNQGCEQYHSHRPSMGHRPPRWRCLATGNVP